MEYTKQQLERIKQCGILQYSPEKVCDMIVPADRDEFIEELSDVETVVGFVYSEGLKGGQFQLDAQIFKQQAAQAELDSMAVRRQKKVDSMIADYLGENTEAND